MARDLTSLPPLSADQRLAYGDHESLFFDLWQPQGPPLGSAVMIHGGFWRARYDLTHASHLCAALAGCGIATASLEYRRVGQPGGGWPETFNDVIAGVKAATAFFAEAPVVLGHSAGGHLALRLAAEPASLRGVVALAPVADLRQAYQLNLSNGAVVEFLGGAPAAVPQSYRDACPARHPSSVRRILLHGTEDDVVPLSLSRAFIAARKSDPVPPTLLEIPKAGHFDVIDPESPAWTAVRNAVLRLLAG